MLFQCHKFGNYFYTKKVALIELPDKNNAITIDIHLNKVKYPLYGKDPLTFINISDISHISLVYAKQAKTIQSCSMPQGW